MSTFIDRLILEQQDVQEKVDRLDRFVNGQGFKEVNEKEQGYMIDELGHYEQINTILKLRLKLHNVRIKH